MKIMVKIQSQLRIQGLHKINAPLKIIFEIPVPV